MTDRIPSTPEALEEALSLSGEILADIELGRVAPAIAALKASRLARLLNDFDMQQIFRYEAGGYPSSPSGFSKDAWRLLTAAGRTYQQLDSTAKQVKTYAYGESVDRLAQDIETGQLALGAARDRDVSVSSANPMQHVITPPGNLMERMGLRTSIGTATERLASRRAFIYDYASRWHFELRFSGVAGDAFTRIRAAVDDKIGRVVPDAVHKFSAVHDNLKSENPEDWSNAVHSCRRILQDLADALFPPTIEVRKIESDGGIKEIKLGAENYINRLVCYVQDRATSERFQEIVGSHLHFLGERLDAVFKAAQKGSHSSVNKDEAHRYVVYTYMLVGDILSLGEVEGSEEAS